MTNATTLTFVVPVAAAVGAATIVITGPGGTGTSTALTVLLTTVSVGTGDVGVLNYAYALEQLEAAFYTQLRTGSYYVGLASNSAEKLILDDLYYHEVIHRDFFKAAITVAGTTPLKDLTPNFASVNFGDRTSVLSTAKAFEDLGVAAYNGAGQYIVSPGYLFLAGKIVSVEARHAAIIRDLVSESTFVANDIATLTTASTSSMATNNSLERRGPEAHRGRAAAGNGGHFQQSLRPNADGPKRR
ncbi:MAG: ferritin-like domain-containing protein [Cytophagaceae bacterium]|nr:MAG: ferritin-like domain-containing protein [Cytophagaceae bacterium]